MLYPFNLCLYIAHITGRAIAYETCLICQLQTVKFCHVLYSQGKIRRVGGYTKGATDLGLHGYRNHTT